MDNTVTLTLCSDLPYDVLCKILLLVTLPAAKSFQLQLVSRQWRQVLTSVDFRKAVVARERAREQGGRRDRPMVACVFLGTKYSLMPAAAAARAPAAGRRGFWVQSPDMVDIDLSFLPSEFWRSHPFSYAVVAAGGGLVCISDGDGKLRRAKHLCVLNPLTRTCKVVPNIPFPRMRWTETNEVTHLQAGTLAVLITTSATAVNHGVAPDWVLATCDLEADDGGGGQWTVVRLAPPPADIAGATRTSPLYWRHLVMCGGESYCYRERKVYVHAPASWGPEAAQGALVEKAQVNVPACRYVMAGRDRTVYLVERRGRVFFMGMVFEPPLPFLWRIWMLLPDCQTWQQVAELDWQELDRLTGSRYADRVSPLFGCTMAACAAGDLLCMELRFDKEDAVDVCGRSHWGIVVGFNLETREWELVYDNKWSRFEGYVKTDFELMPHSFLF